MPQVVPSVSQVFSQAWNQGLAATAQFIVFLCVAFFVYLATRRPIPEVLAAAQSTGDPTADAARDVMLSMQRNTARATRWTGSREHTPKPPSGPSDPPPSVPPAVDAIGSAAEAAEALPSTAFEEEFLHQMRARAQNDEVRLSEDIVRLRRYELVEFIFFVCLAILTVVFISAGAVAIMTEKGHLTVALMSGIAGLFTGAGTAIVKGLAIYTNRQRQEMARNREDTNRTSQAIQAAFAIRDPKRRDAEILRLAEWLRERAFPASSVPREPAA
jgi:hypothetical protein